MWMEQEDEMDEKDEKDEEIEEDEAASAFDYPTLAIHLTPVVNPMSIGCLAGRTGADAMANIFSCYRLGGCRRLSEPAAAPTTTPTQSLMIRTSPSNLFDRS